MASTAFLARATELTNGNMMPAAPLSITNLTTSASTLGMRTIGGVAPRHAKSMFRNSLSPALPCSKSISNQSNPIPAAISTAAGEPRLRNVPAKKPALSRARSIHCITTPQPTNFHLYFAMQVYHGQALYQREPVSHRSISSANSSAEAYRSSGRSAIAFRQMDSKEMGTSLLTCRGGANSPLMRALSTCSSVPRLVYL